MKTLKLGEIEKFSTEELIKGLESKRFSLLKSLGANKLRKEMVPVGISCHFITSSITSVSKLSQRTQKEIASDWLNFYAPAVLGSEPIESKNGIIIGFNHPSLGEVPRLIGTCLKYYPGRTYLFPVNLPWYECLQGCRKRLLQFGIIITPMITPSTEKKIAAVTENDKNIMDVVNKIKMRFERHYFDLCREQIEAKGIVAIAPSATRQATVFKTKGQYEGTEKILPTMAIMAKFLARAQAHCEFVPLTIRKPVDGNKGLNLFKTYYFIFHRSFSPYRARELGREFDREFLKSIADSLGTTEIYPS